MDFTSNSTKKPVAFDETNDTREGSGSDSDSDSDDEVGHVPQAPAGPRTGRPQPAHRRAQADEVPDRSEQRTSSSSSTTTNIEVPQIDREELSYLEKAGSGLTADVFRGEWNGQIVAIKQLNFTSKKCASVKQQVAFSRETSVAAKIRHTNLVQFHGMCIDRQPFLLVTEFMAGGTVFDLLHSEDAVLLRWKQRLRMCSDIASAMDYLHKCSPQIIHRDLKSLNLLLSKKMASTKDVPEVKVSDFGLSKMKEERDEWGMMTVQAGTFHWMAPEVNTGKYDEKADVYSYAMVLFEIICYEVPFQELGASEVSAAVCSGARPSLDAVPAECPVKLMELMVSCWTQDPRSRPDFTKIRTALNTIAFSMLG